GLGGAVDTLHDRRARAGDARDVDDRAATAAAARVLDQRPRAVQVAFDVDLEGLVDRRVGRVDQRAEVRIGRRVVDQTIDPAEAVDRAREHGVDVLGLAGVTGDGDRAIGGQRARDLVEIGLLARREHDPRAGVDGRAGDRLADSATRTRDDDDLVFQHARNVSPEPIRRWLV